ncbi:putative ATP-binding protein [Klebsiella pneumoniae]|uniref:Putative ATP-binding protein n=1 Tax=Klebsiella pneumoniae TaxID=573 RepID=A0A2X3GTH7_KLEPN|nr:putative ATP-binding protein [Klebsiella pneumoniae]
MNSQSQAKSPERLRAMVAGTLANFQHPTLKHNLTALKALHHVAWLDDTVHIELQMPFVWSSAFEALKEQCSAELLRITGAKAIGLEADPQHRDPQAGEKPARGQRREKHYRHQLRQRRRR